MKQYIYALVFALTIVAHGVRAEGYDQVARLRELKTNLSEAKTQVEEAKWLTELGYFYLLKPGETKEDLQLARYYCHSVARLNHQLHSDRIGGDVFLLESHIEKESGNTASAIQKVNAAITLFRKAKNPDREGAALMELRHYYHWDGPGMDKRIDIVKMAVNRFAVAGDKIHEADANLELGDLYQLKGKPAEAISRLRKAITLYKQSDYLALQSVYNLIGHIYTVSGDLNNGLTYGHLAVKVLEERRDTSIVAATTYNRLGVTYAKLERFETALEFLQKGLSYAIKNGWDDGTVEILGNIIDTSIKMGAKMNAQISYLEKLLQKHSKNMTLFVKYEIEEDLRVFFLKSRNAPKTLYYLNKCLAYESEGNTSFNANLYRDAVEYYLMVGNIKMAQAYLDKYALLKNRTSDLSILQDYYYVSYRTDSVSGKFRNAFLNHLNYKAYSDSLNLLRSKDELKVLAARYDLEKKDAEIKLKSENIKLLEKDIATQGELLDRSNTTRNVTIVAFLISFLLLFSLFSRWKIVQKYSNSIAQKNSYLEQLVREKEWLVREVHHRVKNNLQMIVSLIDSQASYLNNGEFDAVMDSKHRIEAMSLIHQKLYLTDNVTTVNMQVYIKELVMYLRDSFGSMHHIAFVTDVDEICLDVSHAIPMGLLLNEAITNSIKYAFPEGRPGKIDVIFKYCVGTQVTLIIKDNGIGLPADFDASQVQSLGMSLMHGLATEVSGTLQIDGNQGTTVTLVFDLPQVNWTDGHSPKIEYTTV
ncbi:Two-component sensor histidine kinase, contains HisKA and HATPase domains [Dyadobacter sp. SG02]|uniref:tetratricopeptide repeat-containing sensor histidine kinase n=1 Tax=Dyadobacter sp. SG02 TaxID=1855291 RepID=UPI0008CAC5D7|nr:histidine kinase dimerization/phosphoacceptor domain -containing protein [Dyadobacter sp. SG02]SEI55017.1 Two-component sensor histidine kinase, contains HisKA and HATPase domains [Dyadobacter sp. SG02]